MQKYKGEFKASLFECDHCGEFNLGLPSAEKHELTHHEDMVLA